LFTDNRVNLDRDDYLLIEENREIEIFATPAESISHLSVSHYRADAIVSTDL